MRVARRIRPSQVGYAATIGRRRLYAASASNPNAALDPSQTARITLVIQPDGRIVTAADGMAFDVGSTQDSYPSVPAILESSAPGR
jgi:hypothetical protein